ncbi:glycosyltransferase family 4 protein [Pedobacter sp. Leaf170]|uniref:glycosyltransferase family 4 protein n=1 Tax=Pedobacter sp. Leaf170 TaxID=2876558 RepID=UPI001E5C1414|nr:glycosyltransferase family 4 protein [Pedobacter sp. Leaf170]
MTTHKKVLFLTLYIFGLTGGIEKVCRSFAKVLKDLFAEGSIENYQVLSIYDAQPDDRYIDFNKFKGFRASKLRFAFEVIMNGKNADVIVLSHINLLPFGWLIKKISPGKRIVLFAHGIEIWGKLSKWKTSFIQKQVEVIAVSNYTAEKLKEIHQASTKNIKVIHNCLDPFFATPISLDKPQSLLKRYNLEVDSKVLFSLNRLSSSEQYKGYDKVIEVLAELPENFYYILGGKADAREEQRVNALIIQHKLQNRVKLIGFINDEELIDHYLLADVFVMPSKAEGFGISFIEAAACGRRSVTGNQDGSKDAILNGSLGQSVNPTDKPALKAAILDEIDLIYNKIDLQEKCLKAFGFEGYKIRISDRLVNC